MVYMASEALRHAWKISILLRKSLRRKHKGLIWSETELSFQNAHVPETLVIQRLYADRFAPHFEKAFLGNKFNILFFQIFVPYFSIRDQSLVR